MSKSNKKEQKAELRYLSKVLDILSKDVTDSTLNSLSKAFDTFSKDIGVDKIGLLRKGEVMLGEYLYEVDYTNLNNMKDFIIDICNNDLLSAPIVVVSTGAIVEYVKLKRKENIDE